MAAILGEVVVGRQRPGEVLPTCAPHTWTPVQEEGAPGAGYYHCPGCGWYARKLTRAETWGVGGAMRRLAAGSLAIYSPEHYDYFKRTAWDMRPWRRAERAPLDLPRPLDFDHAPRRRRW